MTVDRCSSSAEATAASRSDAMPVYALGEVEPSIDGAAYVHPDAVVIGDVTIGPESSVWPSAVLRGDPGGIIIGARTSIQDGTVIHTTPITPTRIGDECVVGAGALVPGNLRVPRRAMALGVPATLKLDAVRPDAQIRTGMEVYRER